MIPTSLILRFLCFILIKSILINIVTGEDPTGFYNVTNNKSQRRLARWKRGIGLPNTLEIQIQYSTRHLIKLRWSKRFQSVANQHLPITLLSDNSYPDVMKEIGAISIYHDLEKCSSVVYFEKLNLFYGIIGVEYFIVGLPNKFDDKGHYLEVVGEPYIVRRTNVPAHNIPLQSDPSMSCDTVQSSDAFISSLKRTLDSESSSSDKRPRIQRDLIIENYPDMNVSKIESLRNKRTPRESVRNFYTETLVFVTRDVIEKFERPHEFDDHIAWTIRYSIIFFAGIDMVFKKINDREMTLNINIAKIVLEDVSTSSIYATDNGELDFGGTVRKLRQYLNTHKNIYTPDSFDHVLMITSFPIRVDGVLVSRMSEYHTDLYNERKNKRFYDAVPITLVDLTIDFGAAAYEFSRTWDIEIDSKDEGLTFSVQCYGIMQEGGPKCENCLKWSDNSKRQFAEFFRTSRKRCFLMNQPRSLHRPGPRMSLTPYQQCTCFGYPTTIMLKSQPRKQVSVYECNIPLQCKKRDQSGFEGSLIPFDGTPCRSHTWVCWEGKCVNMKSTCNKI